MFFGSVGRRVVDGVTMTWIRCADCGEFTKLWKVIETDEGKKKVCDPNCRQSPEFAKPQASKVRLFLTVIPMAALSLAVLACSLQTQSLSAPLPTVTAQATATISVPTAIVHSVTANSAPLYVCPWSGCAEIQQLPHGEIVTIISARIDWLYVSSVRLGCEGWIHYSDVR